jgi:FixJ family two-component response regulator
MHNKEALVIIIDDDLSVRRSLSLFLKAAGYNVKAYSSSEEYLESTPYEGKGCIILDVNLEGKSGLELQEELSSRASNLPVIFITGYGDIQMSVKALKKGAINFLEKPFSEEELLQPVAEALLLSGKLITEKEEIIQAQKLIGALTPREIEILQYIVTGMLNKQIAGELNIAEHTVKIHRHSICEKLGVKSVPEILRIADKARKQ